ncbi:MAG: phosphate ABC transporter permease subunit PstC [Microthrixaceae bacterium]
MSELSLDDFRGDVRRQRTEKIVHVLLWAAGFFSVVISALIIGSLIREAWTFITQVDWSTVIGPEAVGWFPRRGQYGIMTLIMGSIIVTVIAMVIAGPIGLATAIYLSEYASPRVRRILKPAIEILAGIPSVVVGFFALTFIAPQIIQNIWALSPQQTMMAAGLGVGVMIIPIIASISEDAMSSVPDALREASYGMGARKITTVLKVVVPASVSGLMAAFIIAISRAMGETMVVFIAAGKSGGALFETDPLQPGLTMTAGMASLAAGTDSVVGEGLTFQSLFFVGIVLFTITLTLNLFADRFVRRVRQKY